MSTVKVNPLAGKPAPASLLTNIPQLLTDYSRCSPMVGPGPAGVIRYFRASLVRPSTGHSTNGTCSPISQAICEYRKSKGIDVRCFSGSIPHAVSPPACASAIEVLAANGVDVMLAEPDEYTPTPAVSHAIIVYNRGRTSGLADESS